MAKCDSAKWEIRISHKDMAFSLPAHPLFSMSHPHVLILALVYPSKSRCIPIRTPDTMCLLYQNHQAVRIPASDWVEQTQVNQGQDHIIYKA